MKYQRILTIQDVSCVGQCSMAAVLPVLSVCGHEACCMPTAVFSTHTGGFGSPAVLDLAEWCALARMHWVKAGIRFDCIYTGYLGSIPAIEEAARVMDTLLVPGGKIAVDPAMADHGKLYAGLDNVYARAMGRLCERADVILPNGTEAAILAGQPYRDSLTAADAAALLEALPEENVLLTGVGEAPGATGFALKSGGAVRFYSHARIPGSFCGTGDLFAACFTGAWARGRDMFRAGKIAANFVCTCAAETVRDPGPGYGIRFSSALPELTRMLK